MRRCLFSSLFLSLLSTASACSSGDGTEPGDTSGATGGAPTTMDAEAGTGGNSSEMGSGATGAGPSAGASASTGGQPTGGSSAGTGGEPQPTAPETTTVDGVTYEVIDCGAPLPDGSLVVFGPEITSYGGWSHANNPSYASSYTALRSVDRTVYDFSDKTKSSESECGGDETLRRTLLRKIHEHTQKHSNGLQVYGTHPDISTVGALVIDLKLGDGTHVPVVDPIHDGWATVRIETDGTSLSPRYRIDPELYQGHWLRITIPAANFGSGTPARLQHVAETTDDGKIDESLFDFEEIDMNVHQMAYIP